MLSSTSLQTNTGPAILCEQVSKRYRIYGQPHHRLVEGLTRVAPGLRTRQRGHDFWALREISFEVAPGETVGIIGRNGSGKSTLLQVIAGTVTPTSGRVAVDGRVAALLELGAGFNPEFTGIENIRMNASVLGLDAGTVDDRMDAILSFADIGAHVDQPVKTYSSGMFVRLAFAVAIHVDPDVLVVDEALAVGDVAFQAKCMTRIRRFQDEGKTLLLVSHDLASIRVLCHRALYLEGGQRRGFGPASSIVDLYIRDLHVEQDGAPVPEPVPSASGLAAMTLDAAAGLPERFAAFTTVRGLGSHGTGDARVRLVELVDENDRPISVATFDMPVRVRIWVEGVRDCTVSVNYKIRDRQLISVVGADFLITGHELVALTPGRLVVVEYGTRLALTHGDYTVRVSVTVPIARHEQAVFVDVVELTCPFSMLPSERGKIYTQAYLPNAVTVTACDAIATS